MSAIKNDEYKKPELNNRIFRTLLIYLKKKLSPAQVKQFFEEMDVDIEYLEDEDNWISFEFFRDFTNKLIEYTGNKNAPFEAGTYAASKEAFGKIYLALRVAGSPLLAYKGIVQEALKFNKIAKWHINELSKNKAIIKYEVTKPGKYHKNTCLTIQGNLAAIPTLWGMPQAKVVHNKCLADGHEACFYELSWLNRPSKLFGIIGTIFALIAIFFWNRFLVQDFNFTITMIPSFLILLAGYLIGSYFDQRRNIKETVKLNIDQSEALKDSITQIEKRYLELQKTYQELDKHKNHLEDIVQERTKQLKEAQAQLVHSEKLASIGMLVAGVAHEINTPLSSIDGAVFNLRENLSDVIQGKEKLEDIYPKLEKRMKKTDYWLDRCRKIIDSLLHFSRKDREGWNIINIHEGIEDTLIMLEGEIRDKITLKKYYGELPNIEIDLGALNQVFMNILINSLEAFQTNKIKDAIVNIRTISTDSDKIKIEFCDNAGGIDEKIIGKIFDPFFTTKPVGQGTGLGLNICYNIIKQHNGTIFAENIENHKGTRVTIMLPVKQPKATKQ